MTKEDIIKPENLVAKKPTLMNDNPMHYCPGCSHGVVHKLVAEVIEEMGLEDKAIGISPVGCAVFIYNYIDIDWQEAAHGRAPALATAIKRLWPDRLVFTYQGDGDLACIGTAETIHALNRGENITIIFINNAIYGMTGGQMAPTTLVGMKTATCPYGRDVHLHGYPLKMADIAAQLEGVEVERENQTYATITIQNYFRLYKKLAGMTGTAETEAAEFHDIYKLDVLPIPTNRPCIRKDQNDLIFKSRREKFNAVVNKIQELHDKGQPILIGTASVDASETLSRMLKREIGRAHV